MDSTLLSEFGSIQYDAVGNMLSVSASIPTMPSYGGTTSYAYDTKNELKTEQSTAVGGYTGSYNYDGAGNPTTFKGQTSAFNSANQNTANVYDKAGNPTTYKGVALTFDAENRLTSYGGTTLTNGYRGDSLRAWKQNSTGRTYFLYSGSKIVCELSSTGTVTATNTIGPGGLISRHTSGGSVFYAFDTHSSAVQRLSGSGNVLSTQTFDAYGSRLSTDGNSDPYAGYQGQNGYYTDWETGNASSALELLTLRYYDPSNGRFLTRDPVGYKGGANLYEYVNDNPTGLSDPMGTFPSLNYFTGCLGTILGLLTGENWDPCNSNFNECLNIGDCLAEFAASALGAALRGTAIGIIGAGCAEGLASALLHDGVEAGCRKLFHTSDPAPSWTCIFVTNALDVIFGCVDGIAGSEFEDEKEEIKQYIEGGLELLLSFMGMGIESHCTA